MINSVTYTLRTAPLIISIQLIRQQLVTWLEAIAAGVRILVGTGFVGKGKGVGAVDGWIWGIEGAKLVDVAAQG